MYMSKYNCQVKMLASIFSSELNTSYFSIQQSHLQKPVVYCVGATSVSVFLVLEKHKAVWSFLIWSYLHRSPAADPIQSPQGTNTQSRACRGGMSHCYICWGMPRTCFSLLNRKKVTVNPEGNVGHLQWLIVYLILINGKLKQYSKYS